MKLTFKSVRKTLQDPASRWQTLTLTAVAATAYLVRAWPYFIKPQLFAEDGTLWLAEGVVKGASVITLKPYAGFFHFPERVFGFVAAQFPLSWAPALFALTAWGLFIMMVYYLLSPRTKILNRNYERLFVVGCLCLIANFGEFFFNFSNSIFLMGIIGALLLVASKPRNRVVDVLEKVFFVFACLCLPFAWFYVPMAFFDRLKYKAKNSFYLYAAVLSAVAQAIGYMVSDVNRSPVTLISVFSKPTFLILYNQIIIPAIRFGRVDISVTDFTTANYPQILVFLTVATVAGLTWLALKNSKKQVWLFLFFLAGMTFASIKSPSLSVATPRDALLTMAVLTGAHRYFIFGILATNIVIAKASYEVIATKFRYYFLVLFFAYGFFSSIRYHSLLIDKQWQDYTTEYQQGVREFNAGKKSVIIPVNPTPWSMGLFKQ